jgi:hypothetical protein
LLCGLLLFASLASAQCTWQTADGSWHTGQPFGTALTDSSGVSINGVTAHSNCTPENNSGIEGTTGLEWQCVEFVRRYWYIVYSTPINLLSGMNADDFYSSAQGKASVNFGVSLLQYPNKTSTTPPQVGDILMSAGNGTAATKYGHVAIVSSVSSNQVCAVMQNWSETSRDGDGSHCMTMAVSSSQYTVNGFNNESPGQDSYPIQGWLRWQGAAGSGGAQAVMSNPTPGSTLTGASATFQWNNSGAAQYWLYVSKVGVGDSDLYNASLGTGTSVTVNNLPTDGSTIYVRLYSELGSSWYYYDYTYKAYTASGGTQAVMSNPTPGSTLTGASATFQWNNSGAAQYWLYVSKVGVGDSDLYNSSLGTVTSATVNNLPTNGSTIYVRLYSELGTLWYYYDYTYKAYTVVVSSGTQASMSNPTPGSTLTGASVTFQWNNSGAAQYWLYVSKVGVGDNDLYNSSVGTGTSVTVNNLPTDGSTTYVRLYSELGTLWYYYDYTYKAYTAVVSSGTSAVMSNPAPGSTLTGASATFQWNNSGAAQYWLYVSKVGVGDNDLYNSSVGTGTSATVNNLPTNGSTIYVRLYSELGSAWYYYDYTYKAYTASGGTQASISNPTPGSTLTGASATFQWNNSGAAQYWLYVSKVGVGDSDLYNSSVGTGTSAAVNNLPTDGSTIYVRLYSELGSSWYYYDYTYKAYTASSGGLQVGKWVTVYDTNGLGLKLRTCASTSDSACPAILTMPDGTSMQITGGPVQATNYTWWNLSGYIGATYYSGWAVQDYIH